MEFFGVGSLLGEKIPSIDKLLNPRSVFKKKLMFNAVERKRLWSSGRAALKNGGRGAWTGKRGQSPLTPSAPRSSWEARPLGSRGLIGCRWICRKLLIRSIRTFHNLHQTTQAISSAIKILKNYRSFRNRNLYHVAPEVVHSGQWTQQIHRVHSREIARHKVMVNFLIFSTKKKMRDYVLLATTKNPPRSLRAVCWQRAVNPLRGCCRTPPVPSARERLSTTPG